MIQEFCNYLRSIRGYSENTIRAYRNDLQTFAAWARENAASCKWSEITRDDIDAFLTHQQQQGLKPSTTNRQIAAISSLYRYLQRQGFAIINPCQYESRRKQAQTTPATIPAAHIKKAYERAQGATKLMLGLLATTGIRIQEMLDLKWNDINFEESSIHITGKGSKDRVVNTQDNILAMLKDVAKWARPERNIFYISQREARYRIYEALRPYSNSRQLSPHAIRHTFATELAKQGVNCASIAKILGHNHIETSQKYIDLAQVPATKGGICLT